MVTGGVETMMGVVQDRLFGPLVAFGLGGIHVEILKDVRVRLAPLTDHDVDDLLHGIKGFPLLQGYRGHAPADLTHYATLSCGCLGWPMSSGNHGARFESGDGAGARRGMPIVDARIRVEAAARPFERRRSGNHA